MDTNVNVYTFRPPGYAQRFHDRLPKDCTLAWGARAIYKLNFASRAPRGMKDQTACGYYASIDLLPDRAEMVGGPLDERIAFSEWINEIGLPSIRRQLAEQRVSTRDDTVVELDSCKGYQIVASPNKSYGYLYILAWRK